MWSKIQGFNGKFYNVRYVHLEPMTETPYNIDDMFKVHLLFEFLGMLKVFQYVKDSDMIYEVIIEDRDD